MKTQVRLMLIALSLAAVTFGLSGCSPSQPAPKPPAAQPKKAEEPTSGEDHGENQTPTKPKDHPAH